MYIIDDQTKHKQTARKEVLLGETRVLLVGEYQPLLDGLAGWFAAEKRSWQSSYVSGFAQALEAVRADPIDLVIIDVGLYDSQAIATARAMIASRPQTKIILLSSQVTRVHRQDARKAGVSAYLVKHQMADELLPVLDGLLVT